MMRESISKNMELGNAQLKKNVAWFIKKHILSWDLNLGPLYAKQKQYHDSIPSYTYVQHD